MAVQTQLSFGGLVCIPCYFCVLVIEASGSASSMGDPLCCVQVTLFQFLCHDLCEDCDKCDRNENLCWKDQEGTGLVVLLLLHQVCKLHDCEMHVAPFVQHSSLMQPWSTIGVNMHC